MKSTQLIFKLVKTGLVLGLLIIAQSSTSEAAELRRTSVLPKFGLGMASADYHMGAPAFSAWFPIKEGQGVQALFNVRSTSPFLFGLGALYKTNLIGTRHLGFHVGGGLSLASAQSVVTPTETVVGFNLLGNFGLHFTIPSISRVQFTFDAGGIIQFGNDNRETNFLLSPFSGILGFSVHYMIYE